MKVVGLLVVLFGGALFYLVAYKKYSLDQFWQSLANFTHLTIGSHRPSGVG